MPLPQHMVVERAAESGLLVHVDGSSAVAHAFTTERDFAEWVIEQVRDDVVALTPPIDGEAPPTGGGGYPRVITGREPTGVEKGFWRGKK